MKSLKMRLLPLLLLCFLCLMLPASAQQELPPLEAYYIDPCGACHGSAAPGCGECKIENEIYLRYRLLLNDLGQSERRIFLYNLRRSPQKYEELEQRLLKQGVDGFDLPILMAGEAAFPADGRADEAVRAYLQDGKLPAGISLSASAAGAGGRQERPAERNIIYIYSEYCEDCRDISPWIEQNLPEGVQLLKYDIASKEGLAMEAAVEMRYHIAAEEFAVPALISGDWVLFGSDQIRDRLEEALRQADQTPVDELTAKN